MAQGGDDEAFGILIQRYQDAAFHLAYVIVGDAQDAEDVTQDSFLKAHAALGRFRPLAPFRPWLLQIVANEARNRRRAVGRRAHLTLRAAAEQHVTSTMSAPSPEVMVLADEQRRVLQSEVDTLRDEDRLAIAGRYFLDLSEAEVAELLGCARGTVKSRVSRGLARLRQRLGTREAVALVVGGVLVLGLGLLAWPDARDAIADRLGLRGVSITHIPEPPTPAPTPPAPAAALPAAAAQPAAAQPAAVPHPAPAQPAPAPPAGPGATLNLGQPSTLEQARDRLGATLLLPPSLGDPDAVYASGEIVWLVYAPRADLPPASQAGDVGLLLSAFRARVDTPLLLGKGVPPGARLEEVQVNGARGFWIEGAPHVFLRTANDSLRDFPARLAGNTLLWEHSGLTLRIESALDRDGALRIATSMRGTN